MATSTLMTSTNQDSARELMNSGPPWITYVNEVVFGQSKHAALSIDENYKISAGNRSALEVLDSLKRDHWTWPRAWYRRNLNRSHRKGIHLEKEVEDGKWLHLIIVPQENSSRGVRRAEPDWNKPPLRIDLHAENRWLRPSSGAHFYDFIKEYYLGWFLKRLP